MKKIMIIILSCLFLSLFADKEEKNFVAFPLVFYSPDTNLAFGGSFVHFQKPFKNDSSLTNLNFGIVYYTLNNQFNCVLSTKRFLANKNHKFDGELSFKKFPEDFYGIGPDTPESIKESYTPIEVEVKADVKKRIFRKLFAGVSYRFQYYDIEKKEKDGMLDSNRISGSDKAVLSGAGITLACDHSNDSFFPNRGFILEMYAHYFKSFLGSDYDFERITFDYRHFFPLFTKHVFCYQLILEDTFDDVPFRALPKLGGSMMLRGFAEGRYVDKKYAAFQTEFRFHVYKKLGMVLFQAIGAVSDEIETFQMKHLRNAQGIGLRYQIRNNEKLNMRADFAISEDGFKFYIGAQEVF